MATKIVFNNKNNDFFVALKNNVDQYFSTNKIEKTGDYRLYIKTVVLLSVFIGTYIVLMTVPMAWFYMLPLCILMGVAAAGIGLAIMHDANHGSYSKNTTLNDALGLSMNMLGANAYFWKQKHNIIHHTYTNVDGIDDDIAKSPIIRQCESQKWVPAHKVQHLYLLPVYSLSILFWVFIMDTTKYFSRKIYTTEAWKMTPKNHLVFWLTKIWYVGMYIVLPIYLFGAAYWAVGYLAYHMTVGLVLSLIFQLAHVVENTEFEHIPLDTTKHIDSAWAEHQVKTTANFAMKNKFINWYAGGLNFQVEHHLFPRISHVHYPAISKIVEETCRAHNMPYNYYDGFWEAVGSHLRVMKTLGQAPVTAQAARMAA